MARLVKHDRQGPYKIGEGDHALWICGCGLSAKKPYCDATPKKTRDEEPDGIYTYDAHSRIKLPTEYALKKPGEYWSPRAVVLDHRCDAVRRAARARDDARAAVGGVDA